jgi:uncharacterized protein
MATEKRPRRLRRRLIRTFVGLFLFVQAIAFMHAWRFTHFAGDEFISNAALEKMSAGDKVVALFTGVKSAKRASLTKPDFSFETIELQGCEKLEAWWIPLDSARGRVAIFHGYRANKSMMLDRVGYLRQLGYEILLVDQGGHGNSAGNATSIGQREAADVKAAVDWLNTKPGSPIILFGTSMGAASVMRAVAELGVKADKLVLECPFATMLEATEGRMRTMGVPPKPLSYCLVFWGGLQTGSWAFNHNPTDYAKAITCPTLLMRGANDPRVSQAEIESIYGNLAGKKLLKIYPNSHHESYLNNDAEAWQADIKSFLYPIN